jgi:ABC-type uncharacterized transport system ATPase subunit
LTEIEGVCDTVGILRHGQFILSGAVADLLQAQGTVEIVLGGNEPASAVAARLQLAEQVIETPGNILRMKDSAQDTVLARLVGAHVPIVSLNPVNRTLEEVYVQATQASEHTEQQLATASSAPQQGGQA